MLLADPDAIFLEFWIVLSKLYYIMISQIRYGNNISICIIYF